MTAAHDLIISKMISTSQGRQALAAAMLQPIRTRGYDFKKNLRSIYDEVLNETKNSLY